MRRTNIGAFPWWIVLVCACGGSSEYVAPSSGGSSAATDTDEAGPAWPRDLVTDVGSGPALFLREDVDSPAVGYVSAGVALRVAGTPVNDRIPVIIEGPLKVRGWLVLSRLGGRVQRRGRVPGTPTYVGPNDIVRVLGPGADGASVRVEVTPRFSSGENDESAVSFGSFTGELPVEVVAGAEVDPGAARGPSEGQPHFLPPDTQVPLYGRPDGEVVATLSSSSPPLPVTVLRERGAWKGIRVGSGPYLVGFVNVALTAGATPSVIGTAASSSDLPDRIAAEAERPLWAVSPGTRVRFDGRVIGLVRENGFARELHRYEQSGETDVFIAVDDTLAIRGMVRSADLVAPPAGLAPVVAPVEATSTDPAAPDAPSPTPSTASGDAGATPTPSQPIRSRSPMAPVPSAPLPQ